MSAWILSRIFLAMAVPSILVAVMAAGVLENVLRWERFGGRKLYEEVSQVGVRCGDRHRRRFRGVEFREFLATGLEKTGQE
jgi:hypothetical protein